MVMPKIPIAHKIAELDGDRLARLKLDVGGAQRLAIDNRLRLFAVWVKNEVRGLVDRPLAVLLMLLDRRLNLGGLLPEKLRSRGRRGERSPAAGLPELPG